MTVISATTVNLKTMADGTLRIAFDISPVDAQNAFKLFSAPGTHVALAALTQSASIVSMRGEAIANGEPKDEEKPKGGELAKLAGMWCHDQNFYEWIRPIYDRELGGNGNTHGDIEIGVNVDDWKDFCRHAILVICDIKSRAELDNNPVAADKFHRYIRVPFSEWLKERDAK